MELLPEEDLELDVLLDLAREEPLDRLEEERILEEELLDRLEEERTLAEELLDRLEEERILADELLTLDRFDLILEEDEDLDLRLGDEILLEEVIFLLLVRLETLGIDLFLREDLVEEILLFLELETDRLVDEFTLLEELNLDFDVLETVLDGYRRIRSALLDLDEEEFEERVMAREEPLDRVTPLIFLEG